MLGKLSRDDPLVAPPAARRMPAIRRWFGRKSRGVVYTAVSHAHPDSPPIGAWEPTTA